MIAGLGDQWGSGPSNQEPKQRRRRTRLWDGLEGDEKSLGHAEVPGEHSGGNAKEKTKETDLELRRKVLPKVRICESMGLTVVILGPNE